MNKYKNACLSLVSMVFTFLLMYLLYAGGHYLETSPFVLVLIPVLDVFGIFFAVRSMNRKESSWIGTVLGIIGLITLVLIIFVAYLLFTY